MSQLDSLLEVMCVALVVNADSRTLEAVNSNDFVRGLIMLDDRAVTAEWGAEGIYVREVLSMLDEYLDAMNHGFDQIDQKDLADYFQVICVTTEELCNRSRLSSSYFKSRCSKFIVDSNTDKT